MPPTPRTTYGLPSRWSSKPSATGTTATGTGASVGAAPRETASEVQHDIATINDEESLCMATIIVDRAGRVTRLRAEESLGGAAADANALRHADAFVGVAD